MIGPLLASVIFSAPAIAQLKPELQTGSHIPVQPQEVDKRRAGYIRQQFANCVYGRNRAFVDRLLQNSDMKTFQGFGKGPFGPNGRDRFDISTCLGGEADAFSTGIGMRASASSMRSMLAEAAYTYRVSRWPPTNAGMEPAPRTFASVGDDLAQAKALADLADCVVAAHALDADALLRVPEDDPRELDRARKLAPSFGPCLTSGQVVKLNAYFIRSIAADGMWHRYATVAPASSPASGNKL